MSEIKDKMKNLDAPIDWSQPDYTGASAKRYVDKYTNRPEDAGTMEGVQNILGVLGVLGAEPADWLNAIIYASKGDKTNAALYGSGIGMMGNLIGKGKESVQHIIKRLDDLGFDTAGEVTEAMEKFKSLPDFKDKIQSSSRPFLDEFSSWYKSTLSPIQEKMLKIRNNPQAAENFLGSIKRQMNENVKKYNK